MLLYIVRHGDPDYTTDTLTEKGKLQAELVGKRLAEVKIDRVFSSPLGRARETAEPLCRLLGLDCTIEEWTREIDVERMMTELGGTYTSISRVQNVHFRERGWRNLSYEEGFDSVGMCDTDMKEVYTYLTEHGDRFLERLGYRRENENYRILWENDEKIALFCHGAMGRAWISALLGIPLHVMWASFNYTHTGVTVLQFRNHASGITAPKCLCYSDMSHLYASGTEHMIYNNTTQL